MLLTREECYTMNLNVILILGEPQKFCTRDWVSVTFCPKHLIANSPCEGFVKFDSVFVNNVNVLMNEDGSERFESRDAYCMRKQREIDAPICDHGVKMVAEYTGLVPNGLQSGEKFYFALSFMGSGMGRHENARY